MSEQPEVLRLSDELAAIVEEPRPNDYGWCVIHAQTLSRAAAELIGLHRVNAELLEALQACIDYGAMTGAEWVIEKALAARARALGQSKGE